MNEFFPGECVEYFDKVMCLNGMMLFVVDDVKHDVSDVDLLHVHVNEVTNHKFDIGIVSNEGVDTVRDEFIKIRLVGTITITN